jgi:hypothetical protein
MDNLDNDIRNMESTSISALKTVDRDMFKDVKSDCQGKGCNETNFNVTNFVKDLEKNLDNFDNIDNDDVPLPSNLNQTFQDKRTENKLEKILDETYTEEKQKKTKKTTKNSSKKYTEIDYKEKMLYFLKEARVPIITILLFILLNNPELIILVNSIPYLNAIPGPYPALILRGLILALILYGLKKSGNN